MDYPFSVLKSYALASWNQDQVNLFLQKWGENWQQTILPILPGEYKKSAVDPDVLKSWLSNDHTFYTPLEWTLIAWSVFAGDLHGPKVKDAIGSFIIRGTEPSIRPALEKLALQSILFAQVATNRQEFETILGDKNHHPSKNGDLTADKPDIHNSASQFENADSPEINLDQKTLPSSVSISALIENGILVNRSDNRLSFNHPVITGYLAACRLSDEPEQTSRLVTQQSWIGKNLTLRYLGSIKDISNLIDPMIREVEEPTYRSLFTVARWLRDTSDNMAWKTSTVRLLAELLQVDTLPMPVRQRLLNALVCSNDPLLPALFRQMLLAKSTRTIQIGVIGLGAIHDGKSIAELAKLLPNAVQNVKDAVCLSLVAIGASSAIEIVAKLLLQADEDTRRTAAEVLANQAREGHQVLKKAALLAIFWSVGL